MRDWIRKTMAVIAGIVTIALIAQIIELAIYSNAQEKRAETTAIETTQAFKQSVDDLLIQITQASAELSDAFAERSYSDEEVRELLRDLSLQYPEIRGITACYEPFGFAPDRKLYCPYYNKQTQSFIYVEDSYDYTIKSDRSGWYTAIVEKGANWIDPYYGTGVGEWFVDYGVPFHYRDGPKAGEVRGIIDFSIGAADFQKIVHSLSVGRAGYGIIVSESENFVAHPRTDYVGTKSIDDLLLDSETTASEKTIYEALKSTQDTPLEFRDSLTGQQAIYVQDSIETSGYRIGMMFYKHELLGSERLKNRRYINICLTLSIIMVLLLTLYFGRDTLDKGEIEWVSVLATFLLLANVFLIGNLQHNSDGDIKGGDSPPIVDIASLGNFVSEQTARADLLKVDAPITVPTGIFIERMAFQDSYNLDIAGQVWQKYPLDLPEDVSVGFRFPQMSPFAEAAYIEESRRQTITGKEGEAGYMLVGWDYRVTLRLNLKYGDFPFDKRHIDIKIAPISLTDNLIFTPDLESYDDTSPSRLAGLNSSIAMPGTQLSRSYFNFSMENYNSDFGLSNKTAVKNVPVLHYNVHLKRYLLNAFVTYLIPIFVALSLIYIMIMAVSKTEARQGIIESMAAFFFVLIFSHIDLRKDVVTADLIFIEFFYFITYMMIILTTLNLMTYTKSKTSLFDFNDNQIYRAMYFPVFLFCLLIVMVWKFY